VTVGGLTFLPAPALGPIAEQFAMQPGPTYRYENAAPQHWCLEIPPNTGHIGYAALQQRDYSARQEMATKAQKTAFDGAKTIEGAVKTSTEAVKDGFEKAVKGYEQFVAFGKDTAEAVLKSANVTGKGIETINTTVFTYSRQSVEDGVAATKAMLASKTVEELREIQNGFAKAAFETYVAEWNKLRDMAMDTAKAASEPIQARVAAFIQLSHAA
jgi:phasin family protein